MTYQNKIVSADAYTLLLGLLAATLPFSITLNSILVILLATLWILEGKWNNKWENLKRNKWAIIFIAFYLLHIFGLSYTSNLKAGMFDIEKKLPLLLFPLILGSTNFSSDIAYKKVAKYFTVGCLLAGVYCLTHALYRFWNNIPTQQSVYGGFEATQAFRQQNGSTSPIWDYITYTELTLPLKIHPTYFAMYVAFVAVFLIVTLLQNKGPYRYSVRMVLYVLLLEFFVAILFLISSRIVLLIFFTSLVTLPVVFLYKRISRFKLLAATILFLVALGFLAAKVPVVRHRFLSDLSLFTADNSLSNAPGTGMFTRLQYWYAAASTFIKNPIKGVGTGDAQTALDEFYNKHAYTTATGYNAHNQYLQTGVMLGSLGLLCLLLLFAIMLLHGFRNRNMLLLFFVFLFGVVCLTESALQVNKGVVFFSLFSSLLLTVSFRKSESVSVTQN